MDKEQFRQSLYSALDESDGLEHHGVKGMHWGVRKRVQTSRSSRKKAKQDKIDDRNERRERVSRLSDMAKNSSKLSDQELTSTVNRLRLESQLKQEVARTVASEQQYTHPFKYQLSKIKGNPAAKQAMQTASQQAINAAKKKALTAAALA